MDVAPPSIDGHLQHIDNETGVLMNMESITNYPWLEYSVAVNKKGAVASSIAPESCVDHDQETNDIVSLKVQIALLQQENRRLQNAVHQGKKRKRDHDNSILVPSARFITDDEGLRLETLKNDAASLKALISAAKKQNNVELQNAELKKQLVQATKTSKAEVRLMRAQTRKEVADQKRLLKGACFRLSETIKQQLNDFEMTKRSEINNLEEQHLEKIASLTQKLEEAENVVRSRVTTLQEQLAPLEKEISSLETKLGIKRQRREQDVHNKDSENDVGEGDDSDDSDEAVDPENMATIFEDLDADVVDGHEGQDKSLCSNANEA